MFPKKYVVICVVAIYLLLLVLFNKLQSKKRYYYYELENSYQPWVRFCCESENLCTDDYINENFNKSLVSVDKYSKWNASQTLRILNGKPACFGRLNEVQNKKWKLDTVSESHVFKNPQYIFKTI